MQFRSQMYALVVYVQAYSSDDVLGNVPADICLTLSDWYLTRDLGAAGD
jgi:hypothetical protein